MLMMFGQIVWPFFFFWCATKPVKKYLLEDNKTHFLLVGAFVSSAKLWYMKLLKLLYYWDFFVNKWKHWKQWKETSLASWFKIPKYLQKTEERVRYWDKNSYGKIMRNSFQVMSFDRLTGFITVLFLDQRSFEISKAI